MFNFSKPKLSTDGGGLTQHGFNISMNLHNGFRNVFAVFSGNLIQADNGYVAYDVIRIINMCQFLVGKNASKDFS